MPKAILGMGLGSGTGRAWSIKPAPVLFDYWPQTPTALGDIGLWAPDFQLAGSPCIGRQKEQNWDLIPDSKISPPAMHMLQVGDVTLGIQSEIPWYL